MIGSGKFAYDSTSPVMDMLEAVSKLECISEETHVSMEIDAVVSVMGDRSSLKRR